LFAESNFTMEPTTKSTYQSLKVWKNICVDFMSAYQDQDINRMLSLCEQDSTICFIPLGESGKGKIHILGKGLWSSLIDCFPDLTNTIHSISSEQGKIQCTVSIKGTQEKDFAGITTRGRSFDSEHIFVFELTNKSEIKHLEIQWDHQDFINQLNP
jgi:hypothetical protein